MKTLLIVLIPYAIIALSFYLIRIASEHKALKSISESNYWLKYPWKWTFEAVMISIGSVLVFEGWFLREEHIWLLIISGLGIAGVGVFSRFKDNKAIKIAHYICALTGFTALALSLGFSFDKPILIPVQVFTVAVAFFYSNNKGALIWNVEVFLAYSLFSCLYPLIVIEVLCTLV